MYTSDGQSHYIDKWDLLIAHPPCTYLSNAGACRLYPRKGEPFLLVTDFKWHGIPWFFTHKVYLSNCKLDSKEVSLTFKIIPPEEGEREVISF